MGCVDEATKISLMPVAIALFYKYKNDVFGKRAHLDETPKRSLYSSSLRKVTKTP